MKKPFTFYSYYVLLNSKSVNYSVHKKKSKLEEVYTKCSNALDYLSFSPSNEVVNKIIKYADL